MQINIKNIEERKKFFLRFQQIIGEKQLYATKYLDFGIKIIRILCYTPEIVSFLEQQLSFVIKDKSDHFDETIVFWKTDDIKGFACQLDDWFNPKINLRLRIDILRAGRQYPDFEIMDQEFSKVLPMITLSLTNHVIEAYDIDNHCCYYAVDNLDPEEFIKRGHLFVRQLNILLKSDKVNLTHGAVFGYDGRGVLLCARGQRGKSTLAVHSLLNGCEYVSDDYQLLEKAQDCLYAYPMYSIITLSPEMYKKMGKNFNGKFCSNNARKDKYVFNIGSYHHQFKMHYPIKMCLFPEIIDSDVPSIEECTCFEKGRAIVQFIHSTALQMRDLNDYKTIKKLFDMVSELPFYKFNLCSDISKNTKYLQQFLNSVPSIISSGNKLPRFLLDITFDLACILDTKTNTFYFMNEFATHLYELLLSGMSEEEIEKGLLCVKKETSSLINDFKNFVEALKKEDLLSVYTEKQSVQQKLRIDFIEKCDYKLSLLKYNEDSVSDMVQTLKGK